jgi:hypothetical protein
LPPFLQLSDTVTALGLLVEAGFTAMAAIIAFYALRRTPQLPTETQKAIKKLTDDFNEHVKKDDTRFADLWVIATKTREDIQGQGASIKLEIAQLQLANVKELTEIKVSLGRLTTSITYIEGSLKNGLVEKPPD